MGIRASLHEIRAVDFERMLVGESPDTSYAEFHPLDKAWVDLYEALRTAGPPLDKVIIGDWLFPDCPQTFEEFYKGEHDHYAGVASPKLVREVADALDRCNPPETEHKISGEGFDSVVDYVGGYFKILRDAYRRAANSGNALMIVIA